MEEEGKGGRVGERENRREREGGGEERVYSIFKQLY